MKLATWAFAPAALTLIIVNGLSRDPQSARAFDARSSQHSQENGTDRDRPAKLSISEPGLGAASVQAQAQAIVQAAAQYQQEQDRLAQLKSRQPRSNPPIDADELKPATDMPAELHEPR